MDRLSSWTQPEGLCSHKHGLQGLTKQEEISYLLSPSLNGAPNTSSLYSPSVLQQVVHTIKQFSFQLDNQKESTQVKPMASAIQRGTKGICGHFAADNQDWIRNTPCMSQIVSFEGCSNAYRGHLNSCYQRTIKSLTQYGILTCPAFSS